MTHLNCISKDQIIYNTKPAARLQERSKSDMFSLSNTLQKVNNSKLAKKKKTQTDQNIDYMTQTLTTAFSLVFGWLQLFKETDSLQLKSKH